MTLHRAFPSAWREHFLDELVKLRLRAGEGPLSSRGGPVVLPDATVHNLLLSSQMPLAFQGVEDGIQGPRANLVAVACQLLHQSGSVHGPLGCMEEDVNADESPKQLA